MRIKRFNSQDKKDIKPFIKSIYIEEKSMIFFFSLAMLTIICIDLKTCKPAA